MWQSRRVTSRYVAAPPLHGPDAQILKFKITLTKVYPNICQQQKTNGCIKENFSSKNLTMTALQAG